MTFNEKLENAMRRNNSLLCVGLDPDLDKLPKQMCKCENVSPKGGSPSGRKMCKCDVAKAFFDFNKVIIDATHDLVCCYKPNSAFYEAHGARGIEALKKTCDYINALYPGLPIILDAKRGDIGNTNRGYAQFAFDYLGADAITVQPYQGLGALKPFFEYKDRGVIVLCHTSNPEAKDYQELTVDGTLLYERVAIDCAALAVELPNIAIVMGATYATQLQKVRSIVGEMNMLVPGVGAQGGEVKSFVESGKNSRGTGLIINASRAVSYASSGDDYAQAARAQAQTLRDEINQYR